MKRYCRYLLFAGYSLMLFALLIACADGSTGDGSEVTAGTPDTPSPQTALTESADDPEATGNGNADINSNAGINGNDDINGSDETGNGDDTEASAPVPPLSFEEDMGISIDGIWFPVWQDASGLLQALGDDYELYTAPSCVFDEGDDKEFAYDGFYLYTNPYNKRDYWYSILLESDEYSTARGISTGNTFDDVLLAYGDGYYREGDRIVTYSISGAEGDISSPCIQFTIIDRIVTAIEIYYPTNTM